MGRSPLSFRLIALSAVLSAGAAPLAAARATKFANLPDGASAVAIQVDAAGNVYAAGSLKPAQPKSADDFGDVFVAKISPDGSKLLYWTVLAGSKGEYVRGLAIDATGFAYATGSTQSPDFPTTDGALQPDFRAPSIEAFVVKLDPEGAVRYSTFIGGTSNTYGLDISLTPGGEVLLTGQTEGGAFPGTPGIGSSDAGTFFTAKIDRSGSKLLLAIRGVGGTKVLSDAQGNIYVAGLVYGNTRAPVTSGAFQSSHGFQSCGSGLMFGISCSYAYVTKLNPTGTEFIFSTYVTGSYGGGMTGLALDAQGNVLVAGTTNSPDYPTTPGALVDHYIANAPPPPPPYIGPPVGTGPPPAAGYVTKLHSSGRSLLFSTYFSGTQTDTITDMALTSDSIYLAGFVGSPDLPGLAGTPGECAQQLYVTRMTPDGSAVMHTELVGALSTSFARLAVSAQGTAYIASGGASLFTVDFSAQDGPITCIEDSGDLHLTDTVTPGQLISVFGRDLLSFVSVSEASTDGTLPRSVGGLTVTFNGIAAPLLYVSPQLANLQVPFEIAGQSAVTMELTTGADAGAVKDSRTLTVASRQPSVFLRVPPEPTCNGITVGPVHSPLALNADGRLNTCTNPAEPGSVVTLFLNGLGATGALSMTGAIAQPPGAPLNLPVTFPNSPPAPAVVSASAMVGAVSGLWQLRVKLPETGLGFVVLTPVIDSIPVGDDNLVIWTKIPPPPPPRPLP